MWRKVGEYRFRKENSKKITVKFSGRSKNENALMKSLYQSFAESSECNDVDDRNDIMTFISLSVPENIVKDVPQKKVTPNDAEVISADIKGQVNELKDLLNCIQNNTSDVSIIINLIGGIFNSLSPQQVTDVLASLELQQLEEVVFYSYFCQLFLQINPPIGFSVGISLVQQLFYLQVIDLKAPASRLLTTTILEWTKVFPKVILEGLIIPIIHGNQLAKFQVDLIVRALKDSLPHNHVEIYLRECLQAITTVNERHFILLQTLIEKKVNFEDCWDILLTKLLSASEKHKKNMAFTKLLLVLLTKQDYQVQPHHFSILDGIVNRNETFLKKSAERALDNLKKKHSIENCQ